LKREGERKEESGNMVDFEVGGVYILESNKNLYGCYL
jgi:hypothetical protein